MFHNRNKAEDFLVRISSQGSELYDDEQLQKVQSLFLEKSFYIISSLIYQ
jgi:hypothetical protein